MKKVKRFIPNFLLIVFACLYLFPIYMIFVNSFKSRAEMYESMITFPSKFSFKYYQTALRKINFWVAFRNSMILTVVSIFFIVVLCAMAAWVFARKKGRASSFWLGLLIATMLIPFQTIMMPLMQEMNFIETHTGLKMTDSIPGLIFMYIGFGAGMGVFLYNGFISTIPVALEEAATIDGATTPQVFWRIVFPNLKPTTMTLIILDVIWIWNDYLLPSLTLKAKANRTIPLATARFFGQYTISWNEAMAALVVTIVPVIIFYLAAQKYIVAGVAAGAVKG